MYRENAASFDKGSDRPALLPKKEESLFFLGHFANTWILASAGTVNGTTKDHRTRKRLCESCAAGTETFQGTCRPCQERFLSLEIGNHPPKQDPSAKMSCRTIGTDQSMKQRQAGWTTKDQMSMTLFCCWTCWKWAWHVLDHISHSDWFQP